MTTTVITLGDLIDNWPFRADVCADLVFVLLKETHTYKNVLHVCQYINEETARSRCETKLFLSVL